LSWNRFSYAYENPIKFIDPNGQEGLTFGDVAGAAVDAFAHTADQMAFAFASPYFHFQSGVFNDSPVELAKAGGEIAVGALTGVALKEGAYALRLGWTSRANLLVHFGNHGGELGFKLAEQYALAAQKFVGTIGEEGVETIATARGETLIFNKGTEEFAVINKEGRIVTYFKAKLKYWNSQVRKAAAAAASAGGSPK
jgi:hypothetical protein